MRIFPKRLLHIAGIFLIAFGAALSARAQTAVEVPVPDQMQLFLLVGQSNMAGRGKVEAVDTETHPRVFVLGKDLKWVPATDPLHFDKPKAGVGLASQFARIVAEKEPGVSIGLIPCAVGGTTLDQWAAPKSKKFRNAVNRALKAQEKGKIAGILWHQGEGDCGRAEKRAEYPAKFAEMIARLRHKVDAENAPLIIGELGRWRPAMEAFNSEVIPVVAREVPRCAFVTSEDLNHNGDRTHFDAASLRILGARYAEAYLKLREKP